MYGYVDPFSWPHIRAAHFPISLRASSLNMFFRLSTGFVALLIKAIRQLFSHKGQFTTLFFLEGEGR